MAKSFRSEIDLVFCYRYSVLSLSSPESSVSIVICPLMKLSSFTADDDTAGPFFRPSVLTFHWDVAGFPGL